MRDAVVSLGAMLLAMLSTAQAPSGRPSLRTDEILHDLGAVPANVKLEYRWALHNDGDAPLEISEIRTSCACLTTAVETLRIAPREKGLLLLTFDPVGFEGQTRQSVTLRTNDPGRAEVFLVVKVDVKPPRIETEEGHPDVTGQNYLLGRCASCHAAPAAGKTGEDLYRAVCEMCHGFRGRGGRAGALRNTGNTPDPVRLRGWITWGTADPRMPGFATEMGGPLAPEQIESLVRSLVGEESGE